MIGYGNDTDKFTAPIRNVSTEMQWHPWIPDSKLNLTKVPNTEIACRLCRRSKMVVAKSPFGNYGDLVPCPNCDGRGVQMSDGYDSMWGRNR